MYRESVSGIHLKSFWATYFDGAHLINTSEDMCPAVVSMETGSQSQRWDCDQSGTRCGGRGRYKDFFLV